MEFTKTSEPQYSPSDMKIIKPNQTIAESDFVGKDKDGIEWVGEGLEDDSGMKVDRRDQSQMGRF